MLPLAYARLRLRNPGAENLAQDLSAGQFQALRQLLLMTQAEAGKYLGDRPVSERAVQYWEAGKRPIPTDVACAILLLVSEREKQLTKALAERERDPAGAVAIWYRTADDWKWRLTDERYWKLHNSTVAALYGAGLVRLVVFEPESYAAWSRGHASVRAKDEHLRHLQWALAVAEGAFA